MRIVPTLLLAVLCGASLSAPAQTPVNRPIRIVVPYVPGGGTDTLARLIAPFVAGELGQQVVKASGAKAAL